MPFDHFDFLAPFYEKVIPPAAIEAMLRELDPSPNCRLLDAGGGTGRVSGYLQEHVGSVVLADISMGMLREATLKEGLRPTCALTESMPFGEDFFDCVLVVDALHHVSDQAQTARELWRIIKPGGRIVMFCGTVEHACKSRDFTFRSLEKSTEKFDGAEFPLFEKFQHEVRKSCCVAPKYQLFLLQIKAAAGVNKHDFPAFAG